MYNVLHYIYVAHSISFHSSENQSSIDNHLSSSSVTATWMMVMSTISHFLIHDQDPRFPSLAWSSVHCLESCTLFRAQGSVYCKDLCPRSLVPSRASSISKTNFIYVDSFEVEGFTSARSHFLAFTYPGHFLLSEMEFCKQNRYSM